MEKKFIVIICLMLATVPLFAGCLETDDNIFTIVYQNIGDEIVYDLTATTTTTSTSQYSPDAQTQTTSMEGTITSKVIGMKAILDGFGYEREALEISTDYVTIISTDLDVNSNDAFTYQYYDVDSKTPIKYSTFIDSQSGNMNIEYSFFFTEKMIELFTSTFSTMPGVLIFSPSDIVSSFEGKSIKKGDTGTLNLAGLEITWTAVGTEKINDYECIIINFSTSISPVQSERYNIDINVDYTVWFASSFPTLIKIQSTVNTETKTTSEFLDESYTSSSETQKVSEMTLESSSQGNIPINWGSSSPYYPDTNVFGDYKQWDIHPDIGAMQTMITFTPSDAISFAQNNSPNFLSYITQHSDAYALSAKYEKTEAGIESWEFLYRDNTLEGYQLKVSYDGNETSILSDENKSYTEPGPSKDDLSQKLLTFSGMENIFGQYTTYNSSQAIQIIFFANIEDFYLISGSYAGGMSSLIELYPTSFYSIMIGNMFGGSYNTGAIDANTGQIMMVSSIEMPSFFI